MGSSREVEIDIAIIGAGLSGLALAVGLLDNESSSKPRVKVFESASGFSEIGAGIACASNCIRALEMLSPHLLPLFKQHESRNHAPERLDTWFTFRYGDTEKADSDAAKGASESTLFNLEEPLAREKYGVAARACIHRARFLELFAARLPSDLISFNKTFDSIDEALLNTESRTNTPITMKFTDNTTVTTHALIGADGIKSTVRAHLYPDLQPKYNHEYAYRALIPRSAALSTLGPVRALNGQIYLGHNRNLVTYPVAHGAQMNMTAVVRHSSSSTPSWLTSEDWVSPPSPADLVEDWKGFDSKVVGLLAEYSDGRKWALHDLTHDLPYFRGCIALVGDAAHASAPHQGSGAALGIEDTVVLSRLIRDVLENHARMASDDKTDGLCSGIGAYDTAFRAYDEVRRPRTQRLIQTSREMGFLLELVDGWGDDEEKLMKEIDDAYRWIWRVDLEGEVEKAREILRSSASESCIAPTEKR